MLHRGITLIELLIAMAILLAIGAIVTPIMVRTLDERRFESAGEQIEQQLLLARSYAQRTGVPVEVRFHPDTRRLTSQRFMPSHGDSGSIAIANANANANRRTPASRNQDAQGTDFFSGFDDEENEASAITEAWATRTLPRSIELRDHRPQQAMNTQPGDLAMRQIGTDNSELDSAPLRLAVFLPDGSAMLTRTAWLTDSHDRLGRIRISAWTGAATYERLPDITDDTPMPDDANEDTMLRDVFDSGWD